MVYKINLFLVLFALGFQISCSDSTTAPNSGPDGSNESPEPEATTGTLEVSVSTSGDSADEDGYMLTLDSSDSKESALNDTTYFEGLEEGDHSVELSSIAEDCTADNTSQSFSVTGGDTTSVSFSINCPDITPLNNKIVFTAQSSSSYTSELFIMDVDGSNVTEIDNGSSGGISQEAFPDVSPDGKKVAFVNANGDYFNIFVEYVDGTGRKQLTNGESDALAPDWSPDGSKIAFHKNDNIYVIDADSENITQLTDTGDNRHPVWSPDGTQIAFMSYRDGDGEIFVMDSDGSNVQALTENEESDEWPAWSPDGSKIVFTSYRDGQEEIYIMKVDGSNQIRLTEGSSTKDSFAVWSPDGSKIAFRREVQVFGEHSYAICTINSDGSDLTELIKKEAPLFIRHIDWSPAE